MTDGVFVGIDTSNYTTSAAVVTEAGEVLANLKLPLPVGDGARGLRQSDALFAHNKNLPVMAEMLRKALGEHRILAVGCSARPRDAEGSYMPCFLAGRSAAGMMASGLRVPLFEFSHQNGHIMAAVYSSGASEKLLAAPFGAFHVSGGTTELVLAEPTGVSFRVTLLGGTDDLNAGQAIDRTGVLMGLHFPCGHEMELLANENKAPVPAPHVSVKGLHCNLSGLENLAGKLYLETGDKGLTSAFVFDYVAKTLGKLTENFRAEHGSLPVLYAGGVMSNRRIKNALSRYADTYFSEPQFSADNAAGVALLTRKQFLAGKADR